MGDATKIAFSPPKIGMRKTCRPARLRPPGCHRHGRPIGTIGQSQIGNTSKECGGTRPAPWSRSSPPLLQGTGNSEAGLVGEPVSSSGVHQAAFGKMVV